ncbi:OmpA family protein [Amylibacter ulvae]|uniref:OmpA family protein n=1 Tax=Paramylibacter ulvae TaxID=1651968 RepID=A0ABQ3CX34_9RHOB|nr:substrate-binding domain-containing protein [Amylibacter ulvae]GHA48120.1 OmpA family protein [Amylibacter ulvae]
MNLSVSKLLRVLSIFMALNYVAALPVNAQDVTVSTENKSLSITGKILFFNDEYIRLQTPQGPITLHADGLMCEGYNCPKPEQRLARIGFAGPSNLVSSFVPELVDSTVALGGENVKISEPGDDPIDVSQTPALEITLTNRALTPDQQTSVRQPTLFIGQTPHTQNEHRRSVIANEGLVPIVNPTNPVESISVEMVRKIMRGQVTNWKKLGGQDIPISLHLPKRILQSQTDWPRMLSDAQPTKSDTHLVISETIEQVEDLVDQDENAIGFIPYSSMKNSQGLPITTQCNLMFHADYFTIKSGEYPLTYQYHLFRPAKRLPRTARAFLAEIYSPISQSILEKQGYLSLWPTARSFSYQGDRLAYALQNISTKEGLGYLQDMVGALSNARRLSMTFRFDSTGRKLDLASTAQARVLRQAIQSGVYDDQQLIFAGFADNRGDHASNQTLSLARANQVLRQVFTDTLIEDLDPDRVAEMAFGEIAPVACNDTEHGQALNRRVELWVRD